MLPPAVAAAIRPSTNGVTAAPSTPLASASPRASASASVDGVGVELGLGRDRHGDEHADVPGPGREHAGDRRRVLDTMRHGQSARPGVEGREPVVLPAEHGDATGLQVLERAAEVEERLGPGADGDHRVRSPGRRGRPRCRR